MVPNIFQDKDLQEEFNKKGYVKIQLLSSEEVLNLNQYFKENHNSLEKNSFVSSSHSSDFQYKKKLSNKIEEVITDSLNNIFTNFDCFGGAYLYKPPSKQSELMIHQDWSIVDEQKALAINCWIPLCDTNRENGTLMVLPGIHYNTYPVLRAPTLPFYFKNHENLIKKHLIATNAKAGEAVILNQSLVHYSPPNVSGSYRIAITAGIKTSQTPFLYYYLNPEKEGKLEVYEMDYDFLLKFDDFYTDIYKAPKHGKYLKDIEYKIPNISENEMLSLIKNQQKAKKNSKRGFLKSLKKYIGVKK